MKFLHISDLHIGKQLHGFSLKEDQIHILNEIVSIANKEKPDAILIAGDVYDKSMPSAEATVILDDFLTRLISDGHQVFLISGNHDSAERLNFASRIVENAGLHIAPVYNGNVCPFTLEDEFGPVNIYMLPFVRPSNIRQFYPDEDITSFDDAIAVAINKMNIDTSKRNILISHQFITDARRCDSEESFVGGLENVSAETYSDFDYVALGHIHGPQTLGNGRIRYCGTPLKYSFSERNHEKSVTIVEILEKGDLNIRLEPLHPLRDLRVIKGSFNEIIDEKNYIGTNLEDYIQFELTDEVEVVDAMSKLRYIYPNAMNLIYDNSKTRIHIDLTSIDMSKRPDTFTLFSDFFKNRTGKELNDNQVNYLKNLISEMEGL